MATPKKKAAKKKVVRRSAKPRAKKPPKPSLEAKSVEEIAEDQDLEKRLDWEVNHEVISACFFDIVLKKKKMPTYTEIAGLTDLSTKTIQRHFEDPQILYASSVKLRALRDKAMLTVAIKAVGGKSVAWAKLFLEATEAELVTKKLDVSSGGHPLSKHTLTDDQFSSLLKNLNEKAPANKG